MGNLMEDIRRQIMLNSPHIESASGSIATFQTDMSAPIKSMKTTFYPVQAEGTPSPDNVLPISGWDGVTVYNGQTVVASITFPQTIYGGYVDLVNGELVVTHACIPDIGELEWTVLNSSNPSVYRTIQATGHKAVNGINYMCSAYAAVNSSRAMADMGDKTIKGNTSQTYGDYLYIKDTDYVNDAAAFTASISGVKLVYELETPIVYPLTAQTIKSLKGVNNVWSNTNGETSVRFWKH